MTRDSLISLAEEAETIANDLESCGLREESAEWYAVNNLRRFASALITAESAKDIQNASHALSRFAVDSLDWGSKLMKTIQNIADKGRVAARAMI